MRHRRKTKKLGRSADHRKALLRNLATSLSLHGHVKTTTSKAKALVAYYEHLITLTKGKEEMNAIRNIKRYLYTEDAQKAFMKRLPELNKSSGHLQAVKLGTRPGDRADVSLVQFV